LQLHRVPRVPFSADRRRIRAGLGSASSFFLLEGAGRLRPQPAEVLEGRKTGLARPLRRSRSGLPQPQRLSNSFPDAALPDPQPGTGEAEGLRGAEGWLRPPRARARLAHAVRLDLG